MFKSDYICHRMNGVQLVFFTLFSLPHDVMISAHLFGKAIFMFTEIAGKTRDVQIFFNTGCNCTILREGVPQTQFMSMMLKKGAYRA